MWSNVDFDSYDMSWEEEVEKRRFSFFPESWRKRKNCMNHLQQDDKNSNKSWWLFADEEHDEMTVFLMAKVCDEVIKVVVLYLCICCFQQRWVMSMMLVFLRSWRPRSAMKWLRLLMLYALDGKKQVQGRSFRQLLQERQPLTMRCCLLN